MPIRLGPATLWPVGHAAHFGAMDSPRRPTHDLPGWYVVLWTITAQVFLVCGTLVPVASYGVWRVAVVFMFISAIVDGCGLTCSLAVGFSWRKAVVTGLGSGAFVTVSWGLVEVFGPWSLCVPAAGVALAPSTIRLGRQALSRRDDGPSPVRDVSPVAAPLVPDCDMQRMTLQDLCGFWRSSEAELDSEPDATRALRLVRQRAICLNEMELRQPAAFAQWVTTGAGATDPGAFFHTAGEPPTGEAD